jgi:hypothetical protein
MTKPLLMQGLPNTGSSWFAKLLSQHIPGCRYYEKEFFNPVCNMRHEVILQRQFGCELVGCYQNIAREGRQGIDDDIDETWGSESYTFTKECNSAFKLPTFIRHFDCFVFLRKAENIFPPGRVRVWSFYEHAWWALLQAGFTLNEDTLMGRAMEAHSILEEVILADAQALQVPVIWWEDLFTDPRSVALKLSEVVDLDVDSLTDAITSGIAARGTVRAE